MFLILLCIMAIIGYVMGYRMSKRKLVADGVFQIYDTKEDGSYAAIRFYTDFEAELYQKEFLILKVEKVN